MASMNGISTYLQHIDSKKDSLRKAILTLAVEWKDLDEHLDSTKDCFNSCVIDLELKQKDLESIKESVANSSEELDEVRKSLDLRFEEIDRKEERFRCFQQAQVLELDKKGKQLSEIRAWVEEKMAQCEMREENIFVQKKSMEVLLQKIDREKKDFEVIQKSVGENLKEIELKERNYENLCKEVSSIQHRMETWAKELGSKEEQLNLSQKVNEERRNEIDTIEREFKLKEERLTVEKKSMEVKFENFEMEKEKFEESKKSVDEKLNEIASKERNCESLFTDANLIQEWTERRSTELNSKEEEFNLREEQLNNREKLLEGRREELDIIAQEYMLREKKVEMEKDEIQNIKNLVDKKWNEIHLKEKTYKDRCDQIENRARELESVKAQVVEREEKLQAMQKLNRGCRDELNAIEKDYKLKEERLGMEKKSLEKEKEQSEVFKKSFTDKLNEISLKEKTLEDRSKELNSIQDWIERRARELDLVEEQFALREEKLNIGKKSMEDLLEKIEKEKEEIENSKKSISKNLSEISLKEINYENLSKEVKLMLDGIESRAMELEWREKQLAFREEQITAQKHVSKCFSADQKFFEKRYKELELKEKLLEKRFKDFESKVKQFEERSKDIESKEKQFGNFKAEQVNEVPLMSLPNEIEDLATLDGGGLQIYVIQHYKDRKYSYSKISEILKLSADPAKLVLEAMEGFYPPHLKKGGIEFKTVVVKRSCALLLENLMMLNAQIGPHVREAALRLAGEWKVKLEGNKDQLDILGFLQLLASYKLASEFDANQILQHFEFFAMRSLALELFRALGLSEKVPDLITSLIRNNKHWVAVRFIVEFGLVEKFPPVPLLKDYFRITKKLIKDRRLKDKNTAEAQDLANDERITCLRNVLNCIKSHKIECRKWHRRLEAMLRSSKEQKNQILTNQTSVVKNTVQKSDDNDLVPHYTIHTPRLMSKKVISYLLAGMDGNYLLLFLNKHISEHGHLRKEVFMALRMSSDPAKICLDAIQVFFHTSHLMKGDSTIKESVAGTCILLSELMRISPAISPQVKNLARVTAVDWKSIIVKQTSVELTLGFLLFVGAYGLISTFSSNEILKLYQRIGNANQVPELHRALGLSEDLPVSNNLDISVPEDLQTSNTRAVDSGSNSHSSWNGIPDVVRYSPDPAQLVLDAVEGGYYSMLNNRNITKVEVMKSFNYLLSRLMRVPLEIKPQVKYQATKFAADWREKVKRCDAFEVGCLLLLLTSYKLLSSLPMDELLSLMEIAYEDRKKHGLFQSLKLSEQVPDFIRGLVETKQHLSAVKFSYAFGIIDKFPPFPLLEDYINVFKEEAGKIRERGQNSPSAQEIANKVELSAFKAVMDCVKLHRLGSHYKFGSFIKALMQPIEIQSFDLKNSNRKRKRGKGSFHDNQSSLPSEPHLSRKQRRAALYAKPMKPNCSDTNCPLFPVEPPPYVLPITGDYFPGPSNSVFPQMNQLGSAGIPNGGYPPFGFWRPNFYKS